MLRHTVKQHSRFHLSAVYWKMWLFETSKFLFVTEHRILLCSKHQKTTNINSICLYCQMPKCFPAFPAWTFLLVIMYNLMLMPYPKISTLKSYDLNLEIVLFSRLIIRDFKDVFLASRLQHETQHGSFLSGWIWFINEGLFLNIILYDCNATLL